MITFVEGDKKNERVNADNGSVETISLFYPSNTAGAVLTAKGFRSKFAFLSVRSFDKRKRKNKSVETVGEKKKKKDAYTLL